MSEEKFYCPVYEDMLDEYGCSEISVGIHLGRFLDDGIPFLMDIETALERKHRCHACPRCPEHFRPKGLLPQQMLMHLGFPGDIKALEEALRQTENRFSDSSVVCHGGLVSRCQLPCGKSCEKYQA